VLRVAADPARFFFFDRSTANLIPEATRAPGPATVFSA
jgi:hypothetical protein